MIKSSVETGAEIQAAPHNQQQLLRALESVLASNAFAEVNRLKKFLNYVVNETISGNGDRLKGFVIACEVFDKNDPSDAQTTTVVRVEAGRLRRRLKDYYESEGADDPVRISIPKGGYSAAFTKAPRHGRNAHWFNRTLSRKDVLNYAFGTVLAIASLAIATLYVLSPDSHSPQVAAPLPGDRATIAVLPFENLTGFPEGDVVATGIAEDLSIDLGRSPDINVISFTSSRNFGEREALPTNIGRELGAGYLLQGSLRSLPPRIQMTVRVSDTGTGLQLWAERFEMADESEFAAVAADIAEEVTASLPVELSDSGRNIFGKQFTQDKEAWSLYKQAMDLANPPSDPNRLKLAFNAFDEVIAMDPEFAGGHAGRAYVKAFIIFFGHSPDPVRDREEAIDLVNRARELDPTFGLTFSAISFLHLVDRDFERALKESEQAVRIQPNDAYISAYHGFIIGADGDLERGIPFVERALQLDPVNPRSPYLNILGVLSYMAGDYETAKNSLIASRKRGGPLGAGPMRFLAAAYSGLGEQALAESMLQEAENLAGEDAWRAWLFNTFRDPAGPQRVIDELDRIRAESGNWAMHGQEPDA